MKELDKIYDPIEEMIWGVCKTKKTDRMKPTKKDKSVKDRKDKQRGIPKNSNTKKREHK